MARFAATKRSSLWIRRHAYSPSHAVYEYGADSIGAQQRLHKPFRTAQPGPSSRKLYAEPKPIRLRHGCAGAGLHARTGLRSFYNARHLCGQPDPVSSITIPCPAGTPPDTYPQIGFAREPFAGNILLANRLDGNAIKLLNLFPAPNNSGLFNNYSSNPAVNNDTDQFDVRVDHNFSSKDSAFARLSYVRNPEIIPGPFGGSRMAAHSMPETRMGHPGIRR